MHAAAARRGSSCNNADYNRDVVHAYDVAVPALSDLPGYVAANRAVTIVDKAGVVRYHWVAESLGVEPDCAEILAKVATLP